MVTSIIETRKKAAKSLATLSAKKIKFQKFVLIRVVIKFPEMVLNLTNTPPQN